jgi:hypothetical protein
MDELSLGRVAAHHRHRPGGRTDALYLALSNDLSIGYLRSNPTGHSKVG